MANDTKALAIIPRTVDEVRTLSTMLSKSALLPQEMRGNEANVAMSILAGQEMGLPPMAAIRGVHIVKGKPVLSADTMVGFVLGIVWCIAMWFVFYAPRKPTLPRATVHRRRSELDDVLWRSVIEGDGRARWPWRNR